MVGPRRAQQVAAVGSSSVVVPGVLGQDAAQVAFAEDQHPVGDLGPGGAHEPFRISIRAGAPGRGLQRLDARARQDRVRRCGELPGAVADQNRAVIKIVSRSEMDICESGMALRIRGPRPDLRERAPGWRETSR